jgi:hypothetical protein
VRALVVAALLVVTAQRAHADPTPVFEDEPPYVDIMTFGVGEVVFEKFGHAAICLRYHKPEHVTMCFNFGVTDFHEGAPMIWGFLRGKQEFWVETLSYTGMLAFYEAEDRDIFVQTLPLTRQQARDVEKKLWASLTAPDARYHYDLFAENCSTRLRDLVNVATGGQLAIGSDAIYPLTLRQLGERGLASIPPLIGLSDFAFGRPLYVYPTVWEAMFHPAIFRSVIEQRLGAAPRQIYHRKGEPFVTEGTTGRLGLALISLLFALPIAIARAGRRLRLALVAGYAAALAALVLQIQEPLWSAFGAPSLVVPGVFVLAGAAAFLRRGETIAIAWATFHLTLWALIVWGLFVLAKIPTFEWNECVLVLVPTDIALPFLRPRWRRGYARVRVAIMLLASMLAALGVLVQPLWVPILVAFFPLAILAFDLPPSTAARTPEASPVPPAPRT